MKRHVEEIERRITENYENYYEILPSTINKLNNWKIIGIAESSNHILYLLPVQFANWSNYIPSRNKSSI